MRHVARTHRVDLDWLIERVKFDPGVRIKFVGMDEQMADMLTKSSFTVAKWENLMGLHQIGPSRDTDGGEKRAKASIELPHRKSVCR